MAYLLFKRSFHPVGQGAFFTEQFFIENSEKLLYNVVYDCGSKSTAIQKHMECCIKGTLHDRKEIDVMFLSHFDNDHVKYVKSLKNKGYLRSTKIFIPMMAEKEWLGIGSYIKNYQFFLSLDESATGGRKVIQVMPDEGNEKNDDEHLKTPRTIEDIEDDKILSGTPLYTEIASTGIIWYYTPFNVRFKALIEDFKEKLGKNYEKLRDKDYVLANMDKLKDIYQTLGSNPPKGTAINLNSLMVMSYPEESDRCKDYGNRTACNTYYYEWFRWNRNYTRHWLIRMNIYAGSCLYTGDTSANMDSVWKRIEQMIKLCLGEKNLSLIQIPHHGSKNSYDKRIVESKKIYAGFTNYDPFYHQTIFDVNLPMKFAMQKKATDTGYKRRCFEI